MCSGWNASCLRIRLIGMRFSGLAHYERMAADADNLVRDVRELKLAFPHRWGPSDGTNSPRAARLAQMIVGVIKPVSRFAMSPGDAPKPRLHSPTADRAYLLWAPEQMILT